MKTAWMNDHCEFPHRLYLHRPHDGADGVHEAGSKVVHRAGLAVYDRVAAGRADELDDEVQHDPRVLVEAGISLKGREMTMLRRSFSQGCQSASSGQYKAMKRSNRGRVRVTCPRTAPDTIP